MSRHQLSISSLNPERFWSKVSKTDACWIWTAFRRNGYGLFRMGSRRDNTTKMVSAHRVSYALTNGLFADHLDVLHRCDNPSCVNPAHLFLGTHADNMADKKAKGRAPRTIALRGEASPAAVLTADKVLAIREALFNGERPTDVSRRFGVKPSNVTAIRRRRTWAHLPDAHMRNGGVPR